MLVQCIRSAGILLYFAICCSVSVYVVLVWSSSVILHDFVAFYVFHRISSYLAMSYSIQNCVAGQTTVPFTEEPGQVTWLFWGKLILYLNICVIIC